MNAPDDLREPLASLPRRAASPDFTARVMARLERERAVTPGLPAPGRRPAVLRALPLAASLLLACILGLAAVQGVRTQQRAERLSALRAEQDRLAAELASLRELADQPAQIYLGGDDQTDFVLDLSHLVLQAEGRGIQPAGRDGDGRPRSRTVHANQESP